MATSRELGGISNYGIFIRNQTVWINDTVFASDFKTAKGGILLQQKTVAAVKEEVG